MVSGVKSMFVLQWMYIPYLRLRTLFSDPNDYQVEQSLGTCLDNLAAFKTTPSTLLAGSVLL